MGKDMAEHHFIYKYTFVGLRFQLIPSLPEIAKYLPCKYVGHFFITRLGKPHHRGKYLLIIGRNEFFQ